MAPPIVGNRRVFPGRFPWPPAPNPAAVPRSPVVGSLPSAIKWNPLPPLSLFCPFPSLPAPAPFHTASFLSPRHRPPPAGRAASPVRPLASPPPLPAQQRHPLPQPGHDVARISPECCRPHHLSLSHVGTHSGSPYTVFSSGTAASSSPRLALGFARRPPRRSFHPPRGAPPVGPSIPPRLCIGRLKHHHLWHRGG